MRKLFITGGAGFIGSAFIRLILEHFKDAHVINFDALTYAGNLDNLIDVEANYRERYRFVRGDIADAAQVAQGLEDDTDAIINFAAESHVDRSIHSATEFIRTNVCGTQVLLDAARARRVRRFVQVSTDEVLGSLPERDDAFFTEASPFEPNSPYSASKAASEHFVRAAHHTHGLDTVVTRCGNNYGARQFPEKLIPLLIANALEDKEIPVYGDGGQVRDWIHVDDHARGVLAAYEHGASGAVYNFGARNARRNLEVVKSILNQLGKPESLITFVKDRPGHDRRYAINPVRAETELKWLPQETWESGLRKTIDWYKANSEWIARARSGAYREFYTKQYGGALAQTSV